MWLRIQRIRLLALLCVVVAAMYCTTTVPTPTLAPRPVATAREAASYVTATAVVPVIPTATRERMIPPVYATTTVDVATLFEHPWPVGTTITSYPDLDELTKPLVDEIIAVLPEYESYVVVARYMPEVFLVPYGRMDEVLIEARTGQYAGEYQLVTWYVPGQTPVVLWGEGAK